MIDEKKIWEMAGDVFDANNYIYDFSEVAEYDWETPLWDEEQMKDAIEKGIRCGIQEFVKSLWHDASEEPEDHTDIVYVNENGSVWSEYDYYADNYDDAFHKGWLSFVNNGVLRVIKWCYLSDILPKEGGEE